MKKLSLILISTFIISLPVSSQVSFVNAFPNLTFSLPLFLTYPPDNTNRIFVVQQRGLIRVFPNDSTTTSIQTFLDLTNKASQSGSERGLLGLAFHPNYATNRYFYVNYTRQSDGATVISRFTTQSGNPNKADSLSELILMTIPQPYSNHNGGMVMFGLDGYLYIGMGDGGSAGDPGNYAQNNNSLLGKILRIDVNNPSGGNNYGIPPGNPFIGGGGLPEIWCTGMRNPWRFSQDPVTGTIYCGDVGQNAWEEIDTLWVGKNYGWRCYEGYAPYNLSGCGPPSNYTFPITAYANPSVGYSVTGGYVYRGTRVPWLVGRYVYGDYGTRRVWKLLLNNGVVSDSGMIGISPAQIMSFGVDKNNELYICGSNGIIYKFLNTAIGINGDPNLIPEGFSLHQNYPNPFNPSTKIGFTLPVNSHVKISVYDLNGREMEVLINDEKSAGNYTVEWDAANYASGVYFYKMVAGRYTDSRKMVLMK
ncbi:MAG: PQQ-dependent sugar dehydrogenase [Ignavibacteria bacterium]|nr:PQQ-dependent sugar dehydrogenase [Ignavibacteria bacterium]